MEKKKKGLTNLKCWRSKPKAIEVNKQKTNTEKGKLKFLFKRMVHHYNKSKYYEKFSTK